MIRYTLSSILLLSLFSVTASAADRAPSPIEVADAAAQSAEASGVDLTGDALASSFSPYIAAWTADEDGETEGCVGSTCGYCSYDIGAGSGFCQIETKYSYCFVRWSDVGVSGGCGSKK